jgi:hypothetical protein
MIPPLRSRLRSGQLAVQHPYPATVAYATMKMLFTDLSISKVDEYSLLFLHLNFNNNKKYRPQSIFLPIQPFDL